ncbi:MULTISPECIES: NAD(P)/FAD-dependent oxidoreductase [Cytobacillus]|uniref:NAD(P)/FAD-dependent oxidoreductase n=1 Tax=Cytobacillus TaxID=2675230 RepID=UPI00203BCAA8|nr:NAD(P)/FAD-dependent oxidoreductase [Cytobacillus oceanisediminis]MCM3391791.1 NAD(P)/FAD-dependent oxidoreductase [Cytobacillus oceanisediminis]MCM3402341.1 NAD(P)/FAD-dependent oxidoreductase [Cytobacillus oceanisediminis]MDK7666359.1 NAD(P)/FAD-dependent oxidoreductase [Cytobacillus oceanisediminis]
MNYDCLIVGGGIAGLQAAIQLGRYKHKVLVLDSNDGRSTICKSYHNILGYPDGVSGPELREIGKKHAESLGVKFVNEKVEHAEKTDGGFEVSSQKGNKYVGKRILLATGIMDRLPPFPELMPCLGISVYVCPDCDGYEVKDKRTIVLGSGNAGANMALTLSYWTNDLVFINHEKKPADQKLLEKLKEKKIEYLEESICKVLADDEKFNGVQLENGKKITGDRGFIAFGGNEVKSDLAKQLRAERLENKHILTDPRSKMTSVKNVWAAGDVAAHSEQVTIAMGEGSQAAIWIHKSLLQDKN